RRDRGTESNRVRLPRQRLAHRHVAEGARHVDPGEPALLGLPAELDGAAAPARHGDQAERGKRFGHGEVSSGPISPTGLLLPSTPAAPLRGILYPQQYS